MKKYILYYYDTKEKKRCKSFRSRSDIKKFVLDKQNEMYLNADLYLYEKILDVNKSKIRLKDLIDFDGA